MVREYLPASDVSASTGGYGTDPNLITPSTPWPRTLSHEQRRLAGALSDIILPAEDDFAAPSETGIVDFIDEWVSAPYPQQRNDNELISSGLALIDSNSRRRFGLGFGELTGDEKRAIVDEIASDGPDATPPGRSFFKRFRYLVVGGYFTSDIGFRALGYAGNFPLQSYPGVSSEVQHTIDEELTRLGL